MARPEPARGGKPLDREGKNRRADRVLGSSRRTALSIRRVANRNLPRGRAGLSCPRYIEGGSIGDDPCRSRPGPPGGRIEERAPRLFPETATGFHPWSGATAG